MKQKDPPHPREIIALYIDPCFYRGRITKKGAKMLSKFFTTTEQFWLNLDKKYHGK